MELTEKSQLKVGERYHVVELPCHSYRWIEITAINKGGKDGVFGYANVAKRHTGKIELYDTFLESTFDDYFDPTRQRAQTIFTEEGEAKAYHELMNVGAFNMMMAKHGLPDRM